MKLPALTLSGNYFDVGTVLLGESSSSFFSITNPSSSKALWSVTVSQGTYICMTCMAVADMYKRQNVGGGLAFMIL